MAESCKKSSSNSIKSGGRGKIKQGAGAALSRIQFTNETRQGIWDLVVASSSQDAYSKGVRPGQAWQLGVDISLICEDQVGVYCDLQPIPGNVSVMADIEGDIYAGMALVPLLEEQIKSLKEQIEAIQKQISACKEAGCSKEELEALEAQKEALDKQIPPLEERKAQTEEDIDKKQNCWDGVLSLYTADAPGFPGEPKRAGTIKLFQPAEAVKSLAEEAAKSIQTIAKEKEAEEKGNEEGKVIKKPA